jgi:predicted nucleotidyltransferase
MLWGRGYIQKEEMLQKIYEFAKRVLERYGDLVKSIVLIGSVARGEFKPESDIDVVVILDDTIKELTLEELEEISDELEKRQKVFLIGYQSKLPTH